MEATPEAWAERLVAVFREVRRVLRDEGTLWVECGDGFASPSTYNTTNTLHTEHGWQQDAARRPNNRARKIGLKPKDMIGAPFLLAFALRADGWYWRGTYIWEKPDAMPESATDRCTTSHSYVFQFSKRARYFFDQDAIREAFSGEEERRSGRVGAYQNRAMNGGGDGTTPRFTAPRSTDDAQLALDGTPSYPEQRGPDGRRVTTVTATHNSEQHRDGERWPSPQGRNARSVWRIATEATSFGLCPVCRTYWDERAPAKHCGVDVVAHFATWPHALAGKIIACATSEAGCCGECGAPRVRAVEKESSWSARRDAGATRGNLAFDGNVGSGTQRGVHGAGVSHELGAKRRETLGWEPSCECEAETVPCTVLDPFAGSATTGRQARALGRRSVLIELSADYAEIAKHRLQQLSLLHA